MGRKYKNILETVGNTPVVRINRLAPPGVNLYVKIEAFNPLGSVKDRLALGVIEAAEKSGELKPGQTVIEATSGNTGIGLAMVCAQKGYPLVVTMAEQFSVERRRLMRFLGAKVVLTPQAQRGMGMVTKAVELANTHGWFLTRQFENEANPGLSLAHDGARDRRGLQGRAARLLGDGIRHRRHAQGRRPRAGQGDARYQDHRLRAGGRAAVGQRRRAGPQSRWVAGGGASDLQAASDAGLDARFHPQDHGRRRGDEGDPQAHSDPRRRGDPHEQRAGDQGREFSSASRRAPPLPARCASAPRPRRAPTSSPCCRIPASATSARRCSPAFRPT